MVGGSVNADGRRVNFCVSDNENAHGPDGPGTPAIWAVNLHGYLAGGWMYARESARLAERFGWRVVNPSLAGFGGSDPIDAPWVSLDTVTAQVTSVLEHLGAGPVVMLGHSMGGALAVHHAASHPENVLGIIYRDGVATPAWKHRRGIPVRLLRTVLSDLADPIDMVGAILLDTPDILAGRLLATVRSVLPDVRVNLQNLGHTLPLGNMLMGIDLSDEVAALAAGRMPILPEWGCFDRVVLPETAEEFARCSGVAIRWVPGGHSWMLGRPQGQADILWYLPWGKAFVDQINERWHALCGLGSAGSRKQKRTRDKTEPSGDGYAVTLGRSQGHQLTA